MKWYLLGIFYSIDMLSPCPSGISADLTDSGRVVTTVSTAKPVTLVHRAGFSPAKCVISKSLCFFVVQILNNWMMYHRGE